MQWTDYIAGCRIQVYSSRPAVFYCPHLAASEKLALGLLRRQKIQYSGNALPDVDLICGLDHVLNA